MSMLYAHERAPEADGLSELRRLRQLLDVAESIAHLGHWRLHLASGCMQWSDQVFKILGRDPALGEPSFEEHARYFAREDWPRLREAIRICDRYGTPFTLTLNLHGDDGRAGVVQIFGAKLPESEADQTELVGFVLDVSEQHAMQQRLISTQRRLDIALDASGIGVYCTNLVNGKAKADARYLAMLGYRPGEVSLSLDWWREQLHPEDAAAIKETIERAICGARADFQGEYRMRHRDGHWVWIEDHGRIWERDASARGRLAIGVHIDISQRKRAERELLYRANHDQLTDLPNRNSFWGVLRRVHAQSQRSGQPYCLAMMDLDWFKVINDTYGHSVGDTVLKDVAQRLRQSTREADWIARWGGEEFIMLMPETRAAQAQHSLERLRGTLAETTLNTAAQPIRVTLSIGIAESTAQDATPDPVITRADGCLYQAKRLGRNRVYCAELEPVT
ncbi:MAG: diguanylate cyclase [Halochromatium sp.]|uniref:sensor domain-containing diguanylate cyclase n=1 Tax=Halochromatium sp. TaxID=2049430 RepID=UPI00397CA5B5